MQACFGQHIQRFQVHGRFRQPHALRQVSEHALVIVQAPAHQGGLIAPVGERHDDVVVGLGHAVADAQARCHSVFLRYDGLQGLGVFAFHPMREGRADVETDLLEVACVGVGQVAGMVDFFGPVGVRLRPKFLWDLPGKGVDPRRLVEVAVHAEVFFRH